MAWSDAARAAAAETRRRRKLTYTPNKKGHHINRDVMAAYLKEARGIGHRGKGASVKATAFATSTGAYTNVKGAHFVDQGLKGTAWRYRKGSKAAARGYPTTGTPAWAAKIYKRDNA